MTETGSQYTHIARYYDSLNNGVDYKAIADFIERCFGQISCRPEIVLDLGCGTGELTLELARRGYDMIGIDSSPDMLTAASGKSRTDKQAEKVLWSRQDMTCFELYGTVGAVVCMFDCVNYLLSHEEVSRCFSLVRNYLDSGGIFIFDVNTAHRFESVYADNSFVLEDDEKNLFCVWQNHYDKETQLCDIELDFFETIDKTEGLYRRYSELQIQRCYSAENLEDMLKSAGFVDIISYVDISDEKPITGYVPERIYITARKQP